MTTITDEPTNDEPSNDQLVAERKQESTPGEKAFLLLP